MLRIVRLATNGGPVRRALVWGGIISVGLVLLAVVMYLVIGNNPDQLTRQLQQDHLVQATAGSQDGDPPASYPGGPKLIVPQDRVPQDQQGRLTGPALALLPDRLPAQDHPEATGPSQDLVPISFTARKQLMQAVTSFLNNWETFHPPVRASAQPPKGQDPYANSLQGLIDPNDAQGILGRVDDRSPGQVCPYYPCTMGQSFAGGGPPDIALNAAVRSYDGQTAYVTVYAAIQYQGFARDPLNGRYFQRAYGLVLANESGHWVVQRAAAESVSALN